MSAYKSIIAAASAASAAVMPRLAEAACTQQEAMAKGNQLSQLVQAKMAQDPSAGQAMMTKMQPITQAYQGKMTSGGTVDWDSVCDQYDALIKEAK